jgi:pimeloyl-ACP methyl ester carboxylesterase
MPVPLFAQKLGTGTNASRRCSDIAISHGFLGNSGNWATVGKKLVDHPLVAERLRHAYALDMRNHGRSPHAPKHSNALMASDIDLFISTRMVGVDGPDPGDLVSGQHVLIGHSMGGAVTMNAIYRRWFERWRSENSIVAPPAAGVADGGVGRSEEDVSAEKGIGEQDNFIAMNLVPSASATLKQHNRSKPFTAGDGNTATEEDGSIWCFEEPKTVAQSKNRVAAAVIVDITPTMSSHRPATFDAVREDLNAMKALDLDTLHSIQDGAALLEALGVKSSQMRNFLLTNLERTNNVAGASQQQLPAYKWRCNLDVLWRDFEKILLPRDTFDQSVYSSILPPPPCPMPLLFVFAEKSPYYNNRAERDKISKYFSNAEIVVIPDAGHFVHYEKMDAFVEQVAPFVYEHMGI